MQLGDNQLVSSRRPEVIDARRRKKCGNVDMVRLFLPCPPPHHEGIGGGRGQCLSIGSNVQIQPLSLSLSLCLFARPCSRPWYAALLLLREPHLSPNYSGKLQVATVRAPISLVTHAKGRSNGRHFTVTLTIAATVLLVSLLIFAIHIDLIRRQLNMCEIGSSNVLKDSLRMPCLSLVCRLV